MKKKWGIIDYLVIATIIIILLATSWTEKTIKIIIAILLLITLIITLYFNLI